VMEWMRRYAPIIFVIVAISFTGVFLLLDTSGLLGQGGVSPNAAVATVNGERILASRWFALTQQMEQQEMQAGRSLSLDDRERIASRAYEELVTNALLRQEYERRGIRVTDDEIRQAALFAPPPDLMASPELQTDGQFDPVKYQRLLQTPGMHDLRVQLESYYRTELPRQKLFEQIASSAFISDHQLLVQWKTRSDSAQATFVRFDPEEIPDAQVHVTDGEIRAYYERNRTNFERPARAQVSVLVIPRVVTGADTAATRERLLALRQEIVTGARTFEDVARTESADTVSATRGGDLGAGPRGRFVEQFEQAAYALPVGQVSQPVPSPFGYHLIRVDQRRGDTLSARHILLHIEQSEAAAAATDRRADSLARIAASAEDPRRLDEASRTLGIPVQRGTVLENEPFTLGGRYIPGVTAWALGGGVRLGEISDLFDWDDGYAVARLDSLVRGGVPRVEEVRPQIQTILTRQKKLEALEQAVAPFARSAATGSLEQAAAAQGRTVQSTGWFTRVAPAGELGRVNEAIGAAFTLPVGRVSAPIRSLDGVFVMRVDRRVEADSAEFQEQLAELRADETQRLQQERIELFMTNLRDTARIVDRRRDIAAAQRAVVLQ
jgi:peptidyl-prolyl cis-trans isomerase D